MLHVHENVKDSEEKSWLEYALRSISSIAESEGIWLCICSTIFSKSLVTCCADRHNSASGLCWDVSIQHVERVKWYGPRIRHLVADIRCQQI